MDTPRAIEAPLSFEALLHTLEAQITQLPPELRREFPIDRLRGCDEALQEELRSPLLTMMQTLEKEIPPYTIVHESVETLRKARERIENVRLKIDHAFMHRKAMDEKKAKSPIFKEQSAIEQERLAIVSRVEGWQSEIVKASDIVRQTEEREQPLTECVERIQAALKRGNETMQAILDRQAHRNTATHHTTHNGGVVVRQPIVEGGFDAVDKMYRKRIQHTLSSVVISPPDQRNYSHLLERFQICSLNNSPGPLGKNMTPAVADIVLTLKQVQRSASEAMARFDASIENIRSILRCERHKSGKMVDPHFIIDLGDLMLKSQGAERCGQEWMERIQKDSGNALEEICALVDLIRHYQRWQRQSLNSPLSCGAYAFCIMQFCDRIEAIVKQDPQLMSTIQAISSKMPPSKPDSFSIYTEESPIPNTTVVTGLSGPVMIPASASDPIYVPSPYMPAESAQLPDADAKLIEKWRQEYSNPYLERAGASGRLLLHLAGFSVAELFEHDVQANTAHPADVLGRVQGKLHEVRYIMPQRDLQTNALNTTIADTLLRCADKLRSGEQSPAWFMMLSSYFTPKNYEKMVAMHSKLRLQFVEHDVSFTTSITSQEEAEALIEKQADLLVECDQEWQEFLVFLTELGALLEQTATGRKVDPQSLFEAAKEGAREWIEIDTKRRFGDKLADTREKITHSLTRIEALYHFSLSRMEDMRHPENSLRTKAHAAREIRYIYEEMQQELQAYVLSISSPRDTPYQG